jgi:hypothetical protein
LIAGALAVALLVVLSMLVPHEEGSPAATRSSGDYAFGGYQAWYDLAAREGIHVARFRRHHDALGESGIDTLIVAFPAPPVPADWDVAERDALGRWVNGGGRLIDVGETPPTGHDDLRGAPIDGHEVSGAPGALHGPWARYVTTLAARGNVRIERRGRARVATLLADRDGAFVVRYRAGRGDVISVANAAPFENRTLARADDARLAYLLARPRRPGGVVAFDEAVRGDIVERRWYEALDLPERVALAFAALAGLLWLAYGIVPLGPPHRLIAPREPTSAEFVDAVAALYARARARDHARDALLGEAHRRLEHAPRTPELDGLRARVAAEAAHVADDRRLIAVAQLARLVREETTMTQRLDRRRSRRAVRRLQRSAS